MRTSSTASVSRPIVTLIVLMAVTIVLGFRLGAISDLPAGGPTIVDLELARTPGVFKQIVAAWLQQKANDDPAWSIYRVQSSITLDFAFAIAYALFLSRLYRSLCINGMVRLRQYVLYAPGVAAAFDIVENVLLLMLLTPSEPSPSLVSMMSASAIAKFSLLAMAAGYTIAAIFQNPDRARVIAGARYSVVSLLIGTIPILALDQGRDLLVGISDPENRQQGWFMFWTVVWALSVWYWSRVLLDADQRAKSKLYTDWETWLPRIIGCLTLFVPAVACAIAARNADQSKHQLYLLAGFLFVLSVLFLLFVIYRKHLPIPGITRPTATSYRAKDVSTRSTAIFGLSLALSLGMLFLMTKYPDWIGEKFGAVGILSIVAANTVFLGCLAVFITRSRGVPVELIALACAAAFSFWNDNHDVRLEPQHPAVRADLGDAFGSWVANVPPVQGRQTPVIVAAVEGGGIRAAYWSSLVLHHLAQDADMQFSKRLFAASSVSGGSYGLAVYAGLRRDLGDRASSATAEKILEHRFLAPMVAKWVGGDLLQWFLPWPVRAFDRSTAMEEAFARAYRVNVNRTPDSMDLPLRDFRPANTQDVPVLFLNSTSVQLGRRVVASTHDLPWSGEDIDSQDPIDFYALTQRDITLTRAAHNSARFPYISPAGRLRKVEGQNLGHIVDGGYFDNTGADTLVDVVRYLKTLEASQGRRFIAIYVSNSPLRERAIDPEIIPWRKTASLGELFSPLRALLQSRWASGDLALQRLRAVVGDASVFEFHVCRDRGLREAPLGWQLSAEMRAMLTNNVAEPCFTAQVDNLRNALRD